MPETSTPATPATRTPWRAPVGSSSLRQVIGRFGDPRSGGRRHEGVDLQAPRGTPVVAPTNGTVVTSAVRSLGGNVVVLASDEGLEFVFSHLDERLVRRGQRVERGNILGLVGTTGNARGGPPHLHFEVHGPAGPVDPLPLLLASDGHQP